MVEYALILVLVSIVVIVILVTMGNQNRQRFLQRRRSARLSLGVITRQKSDNKVAAGK